MTGRHAVSIALSASAIALGLAVTVSPVPVDAHKAVTSKYLYNEHLFPLFREHCGRCHVDGGVAPMSLLTYDDAAPWGESLRLELLDEGTKPWHQFVALTPRELDMILVWASGGSPKGDAAKTPPPVPLVNEWASGDPDVKLAMVKPFTLEAAANDGSIEASFVDGAKGRTIAAVDLLPGTPAIVRSAAITLRTADGKVTPLGEWLPGAAQAVRLKAPVTVPPGASIVATIQYRRTWKYEGQVLTDRSTIGLYVAAPAASRTARPPAR